MPLSLHIGSRFPTTGHYVRKLGTGNALRPERELLHFSLLPAAVEASTKVPVFDRGTESKHARLGQAVIRLPSADLSLYYSIE